MPDNQGPIGLLKRWIFGLEEGTGAPAGHAPTATSLQPPPGDVPLPPGPRLAEGVEAPLPPLLASNVDDDPGTVEDRTATSDAGPLDDVPADPTEEFSSVLVEVQAPEVLPEPTADDVPMAPSSPERDETAEPSPSTPGPLGVEAAVAVPVEPDGVGFVAHALWMPKLGDDDSECEDAFAVVEDRGRAAIADGASEGIFSRAWSTLLTESVVAEPIDPLDPDAVAGRLDTLRHEWLRRIDYPTRRYTQQSKVDQTGAGATLLIFQTTRADRQRRPVGPGRRTGDGDRDGGLEGLGAGRFLPVPRP